MQARTVRLLASIVAMDIVGSLPQFRYPPDYRAQSTVAPRVYTPPAIVPASQTGGACTAATSSNGSVILFPSHPALAEALERHRSAHHCGRPELRPGARPR
jgi:hypothetical protein